MYDGELAVVAAAVAGVAGVVVHGAHPAAQLPARIDVVGVIAALSVPIFIFVPVLAWLKVSYLHNNEFMQGH